MAAERFTVSSKDGVPISVQKTGSGPALLLIHGAMLNGSLSWAAVTSRLAKNFTVYAMDRRGRAPSGDSDDYSISKEADDIAAVVEAIGEPVIVLTHSYGALSTLVALDRLKNVSRLILYEPPVVLEPVKNDHVDAMDRALSTGDREQVAAIFLRDQIGMPADQLSRMRASPIWPIVLEVSPTLPRESRSVNTHKLANERLANWKTPTTVFLGTESKGLLRNAAFFVRDAIPGCELVMLEGQGHGAMLEAPDYFVAKVMEVVGQ